MIPERVGHATLLLGVDEMGDTRFGEKVAKCGGISNSDW